MAVARPAKRVRARANCNSSRALAEFLEKVDPAVAYISVPTRPPAEKWAAMPSEAKLNNQNSKITSPNLSSNRCFELDRRH